MIKQTSTQTLPAQLYDEIVSFLNAWKLYPKEQINNVKISFEMITDIEKQPQEFFGTQLHRTYKYIISKEELLMRKTITK